MGGKIFAEPKVKKEKKGKEPKELKEGELSWADRMTELRKKYPKAYMPWNQEEDDALTIQFNKGVTQAQRLSKDFGRQRGSIKMRLEKLGLIESDDNRWGK